MFARGYYGICWPKNHWLSLGPHMALERLGHPVSRRSFRKHQRHTPSWLAGGWNNMLCIYNYIIYLYSEQIFLLVFSHMMENHYSHVYSLYILLDKSTINKPLFNSYVSLLEDRFGCPSDNQHRTPLSCGLQDDFPVWNSHCWIPWKV